MGVECPLSTSQIVDVIMEFVSLFNASAKIYVYAYQKGFIRRIIESVLDGHGDVITGLWSRQSGKSEALACLATGLCVMLPTFARAFPQDPRFVQYAEGFKIGIFAPKERQATIIYDRIRDRANKTESLEIYADPDINIGISASRGDMIKWSNGSYVIAQTASEQSSVEGGTYHLIIIDEAQLVSKHKIHKEIAPMLAATNGTMVKIGTANALRGGFKESIIDNITMEKKTADPDWWRSAEGANYAVQFPDRAGRCVRNHFEYPYDQVIREKRRVYEITKNIFHLNYENWVMGELRRLGNNLENEEFRQNFRLLWQEADLLAIDPDSLSWAGQVSMSFVFQSFNQYIVAGLDYAKKRDATILTLAAVDHENPVIDERAFVRLGEEMPVFHTKRVLAWYEIQGRKWQTIIQAVVEILSNYSCKLVVADATGVGDPVTEMLQDLIPGTNIVPFIMSHVGNDVVYKYYIQELEAGRWLYPASQEAQRTHVYQQFIHQHSVLVKERVGVYIKCYAPEGEHDDFCDSNALACHASRLPVVAEVVKDFNPFYGSRVQPLPEMTATNFRADRYRR